jgi:CheY-like chemotaxis protein
LQEESSDVADDRQTAGIPAWDAAAAALRATAPVAQTRGVALGHDAHVAVDLYVAADRGGLTQLLAMVLVGAVLDAEPGAQVTLVAVRSAPGRLRYEVRGPARPVFSDAGRRLAERISAGVDAGPPPTIDVAVAQSGPPAARGLREIAPSVRADAAGREHAVVLCIDDNPANARLLAGALARRPGIEAVFAEDASAGIRLVEERHPDLVLLDLHLPDLPGTVVLEHVRANPLTAGTPVAILSADVLPGRADEVVRAGADAFIGKPLDIAELLATVDRLLAR